MKQLIRRLSKVADSSQYILLRSNSSPPKPSRSKSKAGRDGRSGGGVPEGHLPVYVGEEKARFVVSAEFLNHPIFVELLKRSAQEYGYEQKGVLRIPCRVIVFERVLQVLRDGDEVRDFEDLMRLFSDDFL